VREVIVYSRRGCHLCEQLIDEIEPLLRGRAALRVRDVDTEPSWADAYGWDIPVVFIDGAELCRHRLDRAALQSALDSGT
jgi:thioredoxin reductase (NADPH)